MKYRLLNLTNILLGSVFIIFSMTTLSAVESETKRESLKVCADPNYMPFSHKDKSGYENQIATLIGKELNLPVKYTWFPQRMGFIRNTLKKKDDASGEYRCDLVIGVPKEFDFAKATIPYMHTFYELVILKEGKLKALKHGNDFVKLSPAELQDIKVGITERSPGALWLAKYALYEQMSPYIAQSGDPDEFPNEPMLKDLVEGNIDAAIVWGPTAAYFSRLEPEKVKVLPLDTVQGVRFDFSISTAVRYGDDEWKNKIENILKSKSKEINEILTKAGIPLLENTYTPEKDDDEDDDKKKPQASS